MCHYKRGENGDPAPELTFPSLPVSTTLVWSIVSSLRHIKQQKKCFFLQLISAAVVLAMFCCVVRQMPGPTKVKWHRQRAGEKIKKMQAKQIMSISSATED